MKPKTNAIPERAVMPSLPEAGGDGPIWIKFFGWFLTGVVLQLIGPFTPYGPVGFLDPWIYTGYFTNFPAMADLYGLLYYPARLAWVLPGWIIFQLTNPTIGTILINAALLAAAAGGLHVIIARFYGTMAGLAGGLLLAVNPYFQSALAGDYPDGPAVAYLMLGLVFLLTRPLSPIKAANVIGAGLFLGAGGFTNMIAGFVIAPLALIWFAFLPARHWLKAALCLSVGIGLVAGGHALVSLYYFNDPKFYMPQIRHIIYLSDPQIFAQQWGTGLGFVPQAYRLALFGIALAPVVALTLLIWGKATLLFRFAAIGLIASVLTFVFVEFVMHSVVLRVYYTSSYLIVPVHLALGATFAKSWRLASRDHGANATLGAFAVCSTSLAVPLAWVAWRGASASSGFPISVKVWSALALVAVLSVILLVAARQRAWAAFLAPPLVSVGVLLAPSFDPSVALVYRDNSAPFRAIMKTQALLQSGVLQGRIPRFWYDAEMHRALFNSISSLYLWGYRDYSHDLGGMSSSDRAYLIRPNTSFVHLTSTPSVMAARRALLMKNNIVVAPRYSWKVEVPHGPSFYVIVDDVIDVSHAIRSGGYRMSILAAYKDRRVLVTGHTGFKGGWLTLWLQQLGARVTGLALAPERGRPSLFEQARVKDGIASHFVDIRDVARLSEVVTATEPEMVFHLAAQALVRSSYCDPLTAYSTNVMGTANVLEVVRRQPSVRAVVNVTSDKCYENREWEFPYRENDALGGHDPYSASKACADILATSYQRSYFSANGVGLATVRAGNVIGGGDWAEGRLMPDVVRALAAHRPVQLRNPKSIRPWQHVLEPLLGYLLLGERLLADPLTFSTSWNFGPWPTSEWSVEQIAGCAVDMWGGGLVEVADDAGAPHEAILLRLDPSRAVRRLGWEPRLALEEAVSMTVAWYADVVRGGKDARATTLAQIATFEGLVPDFALRRTGRA